jgi:hypothetical protein
MLAAVVAVGAMIIAQDTSSVLTDDPSARRSPEVTGESKPSASIAAELGSIPRKSSTESPRAVQPDSNPDLLVAKALDAFAHLTIHDFRHAEALRDFADAKRLGLLAAAKKTRPEAYQGKFAVRLLGFLEQADGEQLVQGIAAIDKLAVPARADRPAVIGQHDARHGRDKWPVRDSVGDTALHLLARRGFAVAVNYLLFLGADPNVKSLDGSLPVHVAILEADWNTQSYLLEETLFGYHAKDGVGRAPFELAIIKKNLLLALFIVLNLPEYHWEYKDSTGQRRLFECVTDLSPGAKVATVDDAVKLLREFAIKEAERTANDPVVRAEAVKQLAALDAQLSRLAIELELEHRMASGGSDRVPIGVPGIWVEDGNGNSVQIVPPSVERVKKKKPSFSSPGGGLSVIRDPVPPITDPLLVRRKKQIDAMRSFIHEMKRLWRID